MSLQLQSPHPASTELHPAVHVAAVALLIWFVIAAWLLFGGSDYIGLALAVITVLAFMVIAIPLALWRAGTKLKGANAGSATPRESHEIGELETGETAAWDVWLRGEFSMSTDREKSSEAVLEILLPMAAVAFGITALGIVLNLVRAGIA